MSTATDIINDARNYASETYDAADDLIIEAQSRVSQSWAINPEFDYSIASYDLTIDVGEPDKFRGVYFPPTSTAKRPTYLNIIVPEVPDEITPIGDFDKSTLYKGDPPIFDVADFDKDAPIVNTVVIPDIPELIDVPFPELRDIVAPEFGGVAIPSFTPELLSNIPDEPQDIVTAYTKAYKSSLPEMKAFVDSAASEYLNTYAPEYENNRARLVNSINKAYDEGTGLAESVEQGIYDRGRSRAEAEAIRLQNEVLDNMDKTGMYVPAGATIAALQDVQKTTAMANAQYASETAIEKAKLELDHLQFVLQLSDGMRNNSLQMAMQQVNNMIQINGQALDNAKSIANTMVEMYNMELRRFEAALQYLSIQAQVYETEFKAALADLEIFRVEAEVAKLNSDLNQTDVELYMSRVKAQEITVGLYTANVNAISVGVKAEAEAVSAFGQEVQAYKALVDAKTSEFSAYTSAIQGNKVKADLYATEVSAYKTRVDAQVSNVGIGLENNKAINQYNGTLTDQYKADLSAYTTEIGAESTKFKSEAEAYTANLDGYKAELNAKLSELKAKASVADMDLKAAISYYTSTAKFRVDNAAVRNSGSRNVAEIAMSGANVYTDIAGAALQAQNTMVQLIES